MSAISNDIHDMEVRIKDLSDDLEHEKDKANFFQMAYEEEKEICSEVKHALAGAVREIDETRDRITRAIDLIPLNDKTAEGLRLLRLARVRGEVREQLKV